jgi:tetratricopeptide (TPR) repeat protein
MKKMLMSLGIKYIDTAGSGQEVIRNCRQRQYDVILCGYDLGQGRNGQEVLEEIRQHKLMRSSGLFFMITGEVSKGRVLGTLENEPDGYLVKPIAPAVLAKRLSLMLAQVDALSEIHTDIDLENYERAIELCEERLANNARYPIWTRRTLGLLYTHTGNKKKAREHFQLALNDKPYDWALFGIAQLAETPSEREHAIELLEQLVADQPNRVEAFALLAKHHKALDHKKQAREAMEWALELSPRSIPRQKAVARAMVDAGDFEKAMESYQKAIKLGEKSVYDASENYLEFANFLTELSDGELTPKGSRMAKEAIGLLHKANKRFTDEPQLTIKTTLMEARVQAGQNNLTEAEALLEKAEQKIESANLDLKPDVVMELARSYYASGKDEQAEGLLNELAEHHAKDKALVNRVSDLLDKPVNIKDRLAAAEKNKQGIACYRGNQLDEAIVAFNEGLILTPRQPSLNLNLAQVLLKRMKNQGVDPKEMEKCADCIGKLRGLSKHHREYPRYLHISKVFSNMQKRALK